MNNKLPWLIVVVLLVVGGVYVARTHTVVVAPVSIQTSTEDAKTSTPTAEKPVSTVPAGWRTFENKENNISISFPNTFKADDGTEDFIFRRDGMTNPNREYFYSCQGNPIAPQPKGEGGGKTCTGEEHHFTISVVESPLDEKTIKGWGEVDKYKQVVINGKNTWLYHNGLGGGLTGISFERNGKNITFSTYDYPSHSLYSDIENTQTTSLEEQILSTLKF